jgi:hypothetical protein
MSGIADATLKFYPRGADSGAIVHSCNAPHKVVNIDTQGQCYICHCEAWLPITVGNILDFGSLEEIWNCAIAQDLQVDIDNKKFTYCAVKHCGIINRDVFFPTYQIGINIDESCNLACPSCRRYLVNYTSGEVFDLRKNYVDHVVALIQQFDKPLKLIMSGNGDPLASLIMRPLVLNWQPKSNQLIKLFTNGLLIKKLLPDSPVLPYIREFQISVDAGSADVYHVVRSPGRFDVLLDNLDWLSKNRNGARVDLQFCLQAANAHNLVAFADLCRDYDFSGNIVKLDNWHTFDDFAAHDVIDNPNHPLHLTAIRGLQSIRDRKNIYINSYLLDYIC